MSEKEKIIEKKAKPIERIITTNLEATVKTYELLGYVCELQPNGTYICRKKDKEVIISKQ